MLLGDLGADVVRIERLGPARFPEPEKFVPHRSRRSMVLDITTSAGRDVLLTLVESADVLIEGNRPGVMERLGLGPDECCGRNDRLVYARMTGWGQDGPLARVPGHDVNYLSIVGALSRFRRDAERPMFPLNLAADYGGGGAILAFGIACALFERSVSGRGQVIDGAMVDGVAGQLALPLAYAALGRLKPAGRNFNDSGSHFYEVYETADGRFLAIGALEPKFYTALLEGLGLADRTDLPGQYDASQWPRMKELFASIICAYTMVEWVAVFDGKEACVTPVLELDEALAHPHNTNRGTYVVVDGIAQPGVAPRFSRTPGAIACAAPAPSQHTDDVLREAGFDANRIEALRVAGVIE